MERELWPRLYHFVMEVGKTLRLTDVTFQPHTIALVFLWAALHDRPVCWACKERNWATTTLRPFTLPSPSTLSRRLRRVDTAMLMRALVLRYARRETSGWSRSSMPSLCQSAAPAKTPRPVAAEVPGCGLGATSSTPCGAGGRARDISCLFHEH